MTNLRFKRVMRYDTDLLWFRLFRVMWERGEPGKPGGGHSNMVSVAVQPKLFHVERGGGSWMVIILGLRIHRKRSYGGIFA